jgi:hypothetical protein
MLEPGAAFDSQRFKTNNTAAAFKPDELLS